MTTWKEKSGRMRGAEGYQFGDITRSLIKFHTTSTWKGRSGRRRGAEGYQFGDLTRSIIVGGNSVLSFCPNASHGTSIEEQITTKPLFRSFQEISGANHNHINKMEQKVWLSLFNACYACGSSAIELNLLEHDDVADQEAFVFIGIPALAVLECCLRSIGQGGKLILFDGSSLDPKIASEVGEGEAKAAFEGMIRLRGDLELALTQGPIAQESLQTLRMKVLHASGAEITAADEGVEKILNGLCGSAVGISTRITQLPFFQSAFMIVLQAITEEEHFQNSNVRTRN